MARIEAGNRSFDVDLVVFDKDGTIVDFDKLWAGKMRRAIAEISTAADLPRAAADRLLRLIGVDPVSLKVIPETPLAVTTLRKIGTVCTVALYEAGRPWHAAEALVDSVFMPSIEAVPEPVDLVPLGNLNALLDSLAAAGVASAILTSDDRAATLASLPLLNIEQHIATLVCGDDALPSKPAPDGLLLIARTLCIDPERVLMVGDSAADMQTGRNAGVAGCIAVRSGTGHPDDLARLADVVLDDISGLRVQS